MFPIVSNKPAAVLLLRRISAEIAAGNVAVLPLKGARREHDNTLRIAPAVSVSDEAETIFLKKELRDVTKLVSCRLSVLFITVLLKEYRINLRCLLSFACRSLVVL